MTFINLDTKHEEITKDRILYKNLTNLIQKLNIRMNILDTMLYFIPVSHQKANILTFKYFQIYMRYGC